MSTARARTEKRAMPAVIPLRLSYGLFSACGSLGCLNSLPMADIISPARRSALMASVRTVGTAPELRVRRVVWAAGLRYRITPRGLPGRPDLTFAGARTAVFVHGCFWHGHEGCKKSKPPSSNRQFWTEKITANRIRDAAVQEALEVADWRVSVIWECETRSPDLILRRLASVLAHYGKELPNI